MTRTKPTVHFPISAQHFIPTGGIGSFFRGFARMANQLGWELICVLDKKPIGQGRHMMEGITSVRYVWPEAPQSYAEHGSRFDPETVNQFKVANFEDAIKRALSQQAPDLVLINTLEASIAFQQCTSGSPKRTDVRSIFYTHHENFVVPANKRSKVFSPAYNQTLLDQANVADMEIAIQSQFNIQRMKQIGFPFAKDPLVLPMPLPDLELLEPHSGPKDGVLFIGRHEPRKNPKLFAMAAAEAGLTAKVLTNKRGVKKFEQTLTDAGVHQFDIQYELIGQAKADFIKSAKIAFHPAHLESYGFSAMETLAAGLPTLLIEEFDWWQAFDNQSLTICQRREVADQLLTLHANQCSTNSAKWSDNEDRTKSKWAALL